MLKNTSRHTVRTGGTIHTVRAVRRKRTPTAYSPTAHSTATTSRNIYTVLRRQHNLLQSASSVGFIVNFY